MERALSRCEVCSMFEGCVDLRPVIAHVKIKHRYDRPFAVTCFVRGCGRRKYPFKSFQSFYQHCLREHRSKSRLNRASLSLSACPRTAHKSDDQMIIHDRSDDLLEPSIANAGIRINDDSSADRGNAVDAGTSETRITGNRTIGLNRMTDDLVSPITNETINPDQIRAARNAAEDFAESMMELKVKYHVPQKAISSLAEGFLSTLSDLRDDVEQAHLQCLPLQSTSVQIREVFYSYSKPVLSIKSGYSQEKRIHQRLSYVHPEEIVLGRTLRFETVQGVSLPSYRNQTMYYVRIGNTLKSLTCDRTFQEILLSWSNRPSFSSDVLDDFETSNYVHEQQTALMKDNVIPIILYYDDIEVCNPIGSHAKIHKLSMFYFSLMCVPSKYRSRLKNIFLLGIAYSADVKTYGIDEILKPFYEEMQELSSNGILLKLHNGSQKIFKCYLLAVSADTPAANLLSGFKEGVGFAFRKCRHCMATAESISRFTREDQFQRRTQELHEFQITSQDWTSSESGINRRSALLDMNHFDIFRCVPHDPMHVLFEGIIPGTIKLVLHRLIVVDKVFTIDTLNYQIKHFPYSTSDSKSKPSPITLLHLSTGGSLRQSSAQVWCLFRLLPLMIQRYTDMTVEYWRCYIILLELTAIIMSPKIPVTKLSYLRQLITFYLSEFKACFPEASITPKHHYLLHIPTQIQDLGPVRNYWCMRFEAKHAVFKDGVCNGMFRNVPKSLSKMHQNLLAMHIQRGDMFLASIEFGPLLKDRPVGMSSHHHRWVKINGARFVYGSFVLIQSDNDMPNFCKILFIIEKDGEIEFSIQHMTCLGLDEHLNCYLCTAACEELVDCVVKYKDLLHFDTISGYQLDGVTYVPQKFDFTCLI